MVIIIIAVIVGLLGLGLFGYAIKEGEDGLAGVGGIIALAAIVTVIFSSIILGSVKYRTFTVDDKTAVSTSDGHEYQIFATNGEVYKSEDSFVFLKFNSANVYGQLRKGHTYRCKISGFRIPILSTKNNIISCDEVSK